MFFLIVGLGNPGQAYRASRHNVGFEAVDRLATRFTIRWGRSRPDCEVGTGRIADRRVCLIKPLTFMNLSGQAVEPISRQFQVSVEQIAVLHDDMDLELGRIQARLGGGDGGHRGVRSLIDHLGSPDFVRFRLGVGRPEAGSQATDHVLAGFAPEHKRTVEELTERAARATVSWLEEGLTTTMNRFNPWKNATQEEGRSTEGQSEE